MSPKTKSKSSKSGKRSKSVKPPTVVVSTRIPPRTRKALARIGKSKAHKNVAMTLWNAIELYIEGNGGY